MSILIIRVCLLHDAPLLCVFVFSLSGYSYDDIYRIRISDGISQTIRIFGCFDEYDVVGIYHPMGNAIAWSIIRC
jgi:hypothetical protein